MLSEPMMWIIFKKLISFSYDDAYVIDKNRNRGKGIRYETNRLDS